MLSRIWKILLKSTNTPSSCSWASIRTSKETSRGSWECIQQILGNSIWSHLVFIRSLSTCIRWSYPASSCRTWWFSFSQMSRHHGNRFCRPLRNFWNLFRRGKFFLPNRDKFAYIIWCFHNILWNKNCRKKKYSHVTCDLIFNLFRFDGMEYSQRILRMICNGWNTVWRFWKRFIKAAFFSQFYFTLHSAQILAWRLNCLWKSWNKIRTYSPPSALFSSSSEYCIHYILRKKSCQIILFDVYADSSYTSLIFCARLNEENVKKGKNKRISLYFFC